MNLPFVCGAARKEKRKSLVNSSRYTMHGEMQGQRSASGHVMLPQKQLGHVAVRIVVCTRIEPSKLVNRVGENGNVWENVDYGVIIHRPLSVCRFCSCCLSMPLAMPCSVARRWKISARCFPRCKRPSWISPGSAPCSRWRRLHRSKQE